MNIERRTYAATSIFLKANPGPIWVCHFCGEPVTTRGQRADDLAVHHLNEVKGDDRIENLAGCHKRCHGRYHASKQEQTVEKRAKLRAANLGSKRSSETRAKMAASQQARRDREGPEVVSAAIRKGWSTRKGGG